MLFVGLWALAALHFVLGLQHEFQVAGWAAVGAFALVPLLGSLALVSGNFAALALFGSLLALVPLSWWASARWPASVVCKWTARVSVAAYWLVTWVVTVLNA